jgi:hypothetical protein
LVTLSFALRLVALPDALVTTTEKLLPSSALAVAPVV